MQWISGSSFWDPSLPHRFIAFGLWIVVVSYGKKGSYQRARLQRLPQSDPFLWPASQKDELQGNQKEEHFGRPSHNEGTGCGLTKGGVGYPGKKIQWYMQYIYIYISMCVIYQIVAMWLCIPFICIYIIFTMHINININTYISYILYTYISYICTNHMYKYMSI